MKRLLAVFLLIITLFSCCMTSAFANEARNPSVVDFVDLLEKDDIYELENDIRKIQDKYKLDVAIYILDELYTGDPYKDAENIFKTGNYGIGENKDGLLFLISVGSRDYYVYQSGKGQEVSQSKLENAFLDDLKENDFADACESFVDEVYQTFNFDIFANVLTAFIVGAIISLIVVFSMKAQLKSVRFNSGASTYTREGSFVLAEQRDTFLYHTITRTPKPKSNSNSSGGGSSGSSGFGGKF